MSLTLFCFIFFSSRNILLRCGKKGRLFPKMPKSCAVVGCNASGRMPDRKFYRFPMLNRTSEKSLTITQMRQDTWVKILNRVDFPPSKYKNASVCDRHFVSGIVLVIEMKFPIRMFTINKQVDQRDIQMLTMWIGYQR